MEIDMSPAPDPQQTSTFNNVTAARGPNSQPDTSQTNQNATPKIRTDTIVPPSGGDSTAGNISQSKSIHTHMSPTTPINDGTFRLTVRWKPANYDELQATQTTWDDDITATLADVFGENYIGSINIIKWDDVSQSNKSSIDQISKLGNIRQFLSPRITDLTSSEQYVFGLRISMGDSTPSRWINDRRIKRVMTISISNSKTNSGNVVTAGHILLKHIGIA
jgi:hypothetical protein